VSEKITGGPEKQTTFGIDIGGTQSKLEETVPEIHIQVGIDMDRTEIEEGVGIGTLKATNPTLSIRFAIEESGDGTDRAFLTESVFSNRPQCSSIFGYGARLSFHYIAAIALSCSEEWS
jgi:hypothetical protein